MPVVRHVASVFAGYLVGQGIVDASMQDTAVGAFVAICALLASFYDKAKKA